MGGFILVRLHHLKSFAIRKNGCEGDFTAVFTLWVAPFTLELLLQGADGRPKGHWKQVGQ